MTRLEDLNILVTGGSGFLGAALVRQLVQKGCTVKSLARRFYEPLAALGVEQVQGDICDKQVVHSACAGIDLMFHTAAKAGVWGKYRDYFNTNVIGTRNIVETSLKHDIVLVHTSSPSVVFNGRDMTGVDESVPYPGRYHAAYPETKGLAEKAVAERVRKGLRAVILRPHLIWGPGDNHLIPRIIQRARKLAIIGKGLNRVDTIYIDNAAEAHLLAARALLENPGLCGRKYFISQDEPIYLWEMVNRILHAAGLPPVTRRIPYAVAWTAGALLEAFYKLFRLTGEPLMTRFVANELATTHWFDISAAKSDLGYIPRVSIGQGLSALKEWFNSDEGRGLLK